AIIAFEDASSFLKMGVLVFIHLIFHGVMLTSNYRKLMHYLGCLKHMKTWQLRCKISQAKENTVDEAQNFVRKKRQTKTLNMLSNVLFGKFIDSSEELIELAKQLLEA
ncbi:5387_t:CDS:2, partial [Gigaspora rosea]